MNDTNTDDKYQKKWKQIARVNQNQTLEDLEKAQGAEENKESVDLTADAQYLKYDGMPLCLLNGVLYAMYPIDDPSLGYKLIMANFDKKLVLLRPKFISEQQAVDMLFTVGSES